jgi:hypothetical protein
MEEKAVGSVSYQQRVLPQRIRWLAIAAGFVTGSALLSFAWFLSVPAILLMFAGIVQPRSPQLGRIVLSVVAPLIGVWVIPTGAWFLWEMVSGENFRHDLLGLAITLSWLLAPILLIWCNAALLAEARRERRSRRDLSPSATTSHAN